jgi:hypothetical protein
VYDKSTSYIRLLHASPNAPAVDIYANDTLLTDFLSFGEFTPYIPVSPDKYKVEVYPAKNGDEPVLTAELDVDEKKIYTVAVIGMAPDLEVFVIPDEKEELEFERTGFRAIHLSPDAPSVDIQQPDGQVLFENVSYKDITDYEQLVPMTYTLQIVPTGTDYIGLYVPNIRLLPNRFYSAYIVGLIGDEPYLQMLIPLDGNSYIDV